MIAALLQVVSEMLCLDGMSAITPWLGLLTSSALNTDGAKPQPPLMALRLLCGVGWANEYELNQAGMRLALCLAFFREGGVITGGM